MRLRKKNEASLNNVTTISEFHFGSIELSELIYQEASKLQSRTAIVLKTAYADVYQPMYLGRHDFEDVRKALTHHCRKVMNNDRLWISRDIWALNYSNGEGTAPHVHRGTPYSVIWYLQADDGCGTLEFFDPDETIEPKPNMCVIFDGEHKHGVLPSIEPDARRVCIVGQMYDLDTMPRINHPKGFYDVDSEFH